MLTVLLLILIISSVSNVVAELDSDNSLVIDPSVAGLAQKFEGIGAISGGGATSKLLNAYAAWHNESYWQIMDYLFKPKFGAALQILKVEIGGDSQSTDGAEASHMHSQRDLNLHRGYEWLLMRHAKHANPNLKLYGLPWVFPGWIGNGTQDPYAGNSSNLLLYVRNWILGAKVQHNLTIDFIGIWNERPWNADYIIKLRESLNANGLQRTRIVATDSVWDSAFLAAMAASSDLREAVDILGAHYPGASSPQLAKSLGKTMMASEEFSANNDLSGGACWARILSESFVRGNFSGVIAWNLISSYYRSLPYTDSSLMSAREPWSGHFAVRSPIWITAQHTHYTQCGWRYLRVGSGSGELPGNGSYVSYVSPGTQQLTIVLETIDPQDGHCFYSMPKYSVAKQQTVTLVFTAHFANNIQRLHARLSEFNFENRTARLFQRLPDFVVSNSRLTLTLLRNTVLTLTTVNDDSGPTDDPSQFVNENYVKNETRFPDFYHEEIHNLPQHSEPLLLSPQSGSWEVIDDAKAGRVVAQLSTQPPIDTCSPRFKRPVALIGDSGWTGSRVNCEVWLPDSIQSSAGFFAALRVDRGGAPLVESRGVFLWLLLLREGAVNVLLVSRDYALTDIAYSALVEGLSRDSWLRIQLQVRGNHVTASIDDHLMYNSSYGWDKLSPGWAAIGATDFGLVYYRNISVCKL